jgi:hypothetical protein
MPGSMAELESWFDDYDARHLTPSDNAARIERATRTQLPGFLKGALYDPRLRAAMKVPTPPFPVRVGLHAALKTRAFLIRFLGRPARRSRFADGIRTTTYPDGYTIEELGPRDT